MKPPWDHSAQASSDLEALQTDVMRFVAILGLCLAAIFSLVNGAQYEQREPAASTDAQPELSAPEPELPPARPPQTTGLEDRPVTAAQPEPPQPVAAPPAQPRAQTGFTLEFESGGALRSLVDAGDIRLFLTAAGRFNEYRPGRGFSQADPPGSYYRMESATVPRQIRLQAEGLFSDEIEWGVTLPAQTAGEIEQLMTGREGGNLLIDAEARVSLAGSEPWPSN